MSYVKVFSIVHTRCSANGGVIVFIIMVIGSLYVRRHFLEASVEFSDKSVHIA